MEGTEFVEISSSNFIVVIFVARSVEAEDLGDDVVASRFYVVELLALRPTGFEFRVVFLLMRLSYQNL